MVCLACTNYMQIYATSDYYSLQRVTEHLLIGNIKWYMNLKWISWTFLKKKTMLLKIHGITHGVGHYST